MQSTEKRRLERFNLEIPAIVNVSIHSALQKLEMKTRNVCAGGAYFRTDLKVPIGTEMQIDLVLPLKKFKTLPDHYEKAVVNLSGRVLRFESDGLGVCFDETYDIHPFSDEDLR